MGILKDRFLVILIILGFLIRLTVSSLPGFQIDVNDFFAWAIRLNQVGFSNFYNEGIFSDYTPGFLYILSILGFIKNLLQIDDRFFYILLKIPTILSEITLGIIFYKEVTKYKSKFYGRLAAILVLLNPTFIFNSSIWGQIDGILALFLYLAIYYLQNKKLVLSSFMLGVAFLIKPQTIALFPVFLLFIIKQTSVKNFIKLTIPSIIFVFTLSLPFFLSKPFTGLINLIINTVSQYPYTSLFAYNFWGMIGFWIKDENVWNNIPYQFWGYILFASYWIIIGYFFFKKNLTIYTLSALATLSFFFLPTRVHERYLYPSLIFMIIVVTLLKSRFLLLLTVTLSLINFLNLYYVYVYYNEFYLKLPKLLYNSTLYNLLDAQGKSLSFLSTFIFILITLSIIKLSYEHKKA